MIIGAHNIISPLGFTSEANFEKVLRGEGGIAMQTGADLSDTDFPASVINESELEVHLAEFPELKAYTKLEQLSILSLKQIIAGVDVTSPKTGFILSTTKGNIDLLKADNLNPNALLATTAQKIADYFGFASTPHVISNACISGLVAFIVAKRFIQSGIYDNVVILGVDVLSKFIVSGFQSFHSLSSATCKPFDANRDGLSLGEGAASVVIHGKQKTENTPYVELVNGAIANDANHISGPSRTGEGLFRAIKQTLRDGDKVDVISAHGTATPYNDDMESEAISRAGFSVVPVSGLKGYFGHTLGAAGIIESIISIMALERNVIIGTKGLKQQGVVAPIIVVKENENALTKGLLKLMSGFGGCNAAVYFKKHE